MDMDWFQGPFDDHSLLLGHQVFFWRRLCSAFQILLGASILLSLLTERHKVVLSEWLAEQRKAAANVRVPRVLRFRDIAKWMAVAVAALSFGIASWQVFRGDPTDPVSAFLAVFFLSFFLLWLVLLPLVLIFNGVSVFYTTLKAGQKYVPPLLAWVFDHQRFDRSLVIINFVLFLMISVVQLYLS